MGDYIDLSDDTSSWQSFPNYPNSRESNPNRKTISLDLTGDGSCRSSCITFSGSIGSNHDCNVYTNDSIINLDSQDDVLILSGPLTEANGEEMDPHIDDNCVITSSGSVHITINSSSPRVRTPSSSSSSSSSSSTLSNPINLGVRSSLSSTSIERTREQLETYGDIDDDSRILLLQIAKMDDEERLKRTRELAEKRYTCDICMDNECAIEDMITLSCQPVGHRYCNDCFSGYCGSKISDALVSRNDLICPAENCKTPISIDELKAHVSDEIFCKFERFMLKNMCQDNNWRTCPHCNEWFADIPQEDNDELQWKNVLCGLLSCNKTFCGKCGQKPHKGQSDQDLTCEEYAKWIQENADIDVTMAEYLKTAAVQKCPKCKNVTELQSGSCKFTYCRCKARFCFLCGITLTEKEHYSHFSGPGNTGPFGKTCIGMKKSELDSINSAIAIQNAANAAILAQAMKVNSALRAAKPNAKQRKRYRNYE